MWRNRLILIIILVLVASGLSACYKDAGENVEPTSPKVNLTDIAPPTATQPVLPTPTPLPATPTRTAIPSLVPTTTPPGNNSVSAPAGGDDVEPTEAEPTDDAQANALQANVTNTPQQIAPSFTPAIVTSPTLAGPVIETPGLSDIQASSTPLPTPDPNNMPTPTPIPVEDNPCIHVVQPNDTLYSIAQSNGILLGDLVAENTDVLWGGQTTPLQIGWQLRIPGCSFGEPSPTPTSMTDDGTGETGGETAPTATLAPGEQIVHIVASGETIFSIGRLYGVDPYAIIEYNGLTNPDFLQPGQELIIPPAQ